MARIGIGKHTSHYVWIVLGVLAVLAIAYAWINVY